MRRDKSIEKITLITSNGEWTIHCYDDEIISYKHIGRTHRIKAVNGDYMFDDSYVDAVLIKYQGEY